MIPSWPSIAIHTITVCDEFYAHDCFIAQEYTGLRVVESKLLTGTFKYLLILQCISSSAYICTEHGDHSAYRLNQWEMLLQCINVSYWLIPFPEWSLQNIPKRSMYCDFLSFLMFCLCFFMFCFGVVITPCIVVYRLGQKFLAIFLRRLLYHLMLYQNLSLFNKIFYNNSCAHVLNITGICHSVMHQCILLWRRVCFIENQVWPWCESNF